nr:MAG TPA: hypothetical protein [Ackermannviridae sp.]
MPYINKLDLKNIDLRFIDLKSISYIRPSYFRLFFKQLISLYCKKYLKRYIHLIGSRYNIL